MRYAQTAEKRSGSFKGQVRNPRGIFVVSRGETKRLFLANIRGLVKQNQYWDREKLTAIEKILARQNVHTDNVGSTTPSLVRQQFTFYMLDTRADGECSPFPQEEPGDLEAFEYTERDQLVLYAKMRLGRLRPEDIARYRPILDLWGYGE